MKSVYLYPYSPASEAAKLLSEAMGIRRIKHKGSKFIAGKQNTVVNYGSGNLPAHVAGAGRIINNPVNCNVAANKLSFFQRVTKWNKDFMALAVKIPEFTADIDAARKWIDEKHIVVCRKELRGNGGDGIVIAKAAGDLVQCPLYVKYIPKLREYRVHVVNGKVISMQRKVAKPGQEPVCWQVRSHDNGFIFQRGMEGIPGEELDEVKKQAIFAVRAVGLDFGGVDVIWNQKVGSAYVLEVNTAPGIEGQTVQDYAAAFKAMINGQ